MGNYFLDNINKSLAIIRQEQERIEATLAEYQNDKEQNVEIVGVKEVAKLFGMSNSWAENLIRDIKKRCNVVGAGNKIPKSLLLREIGHIERN